MKNIFYVLIMGLLFACSPSNNRRSIPLVVNDIIEITPGILQGDLEVTVDLPKGGGDIWTHQMLMMDSEPLTIPARVAMLGRKQDLSSYIVSIELIDTNDLTITCTYKLNPAGSLVLNTCTLGAKADESIQVKSVKLIIQRATGMRPAATFKTVFYWE